MDEDFERRREMRRQRREEMRLEAERISYQRSEEDEEEAARERRRRARQERLRNKDFEEPVATVTESSVINNRNSMTERETFSTSVSSAAGEDDQALQERLAQREERRQRRLREALERQKELDPTVADGVTITESSQEERPSGRWGRYRDTEEEQEQKPNVRKEEEEEQREEEGEEKQEEEGAASEEEEEQEEPEEEEEEQEEEEEAEEQPHDSDKEVEDIFSNKTMISAVEKPMSVSEKEVEEDQVMPEKEAEQKVVISEEEVQEQPLISAEEVEEKTKEVTKESRVSTPPKQHNGGFHDDTPAKHKKPERTPSRGHMRSPDADEADDAARLEAERKLEELKRRRDDAESEEFERMRQKQQEAEAELEELKKKREERRKVLEEEERQRKLEEEEKKAREEEEKRKMKEEIERRRAEAAEKRQKVEESNDGETTKPFKCIIPRGTMLKIGERAEFLNKSAQKSSTVKTLHTPIISKIDNRLEQYTTALQSNKDSRSPRSAAVDLPMVTDGIRNIKSMWERGNMSGSHGGHGNVNKEASGLKFGVSARISDWLNKTPENTKPAGGRPIDLKPGDVTSKRNLWENKGSSPQVTAGGKSKTVTNAGVGH